MWLWRVRWTCPSAFWCSLSFWSPREECICAQTLLLQLLQSCFSVLQSDPPVASEEEKPAAQCPERMQAAQELYTHLCDGRDWGVPWMCLCTGGHLAIEVWEVQWSWTCLPPFSPPSLSFLFFPWEWVSCIPTGLPLNKQLRMTLNFSSSYLYLLGSRIICKRHYNVLCGPGSQTQNITNG